MKNRRKEVAISTIFVKIAGYCVDDWELNGNRRARTADKEIKGQLASRSDPVYYRFYSSLAAVAAGQFSP